MMDLRGIISEMQAKGYEDPSRTSGLPLQQKLLRSFGLLKNEHTGSFSGRAKPQDDTETGCHSEAGG